MAGKLPAGQRKAARGLNRYKKKSFCYYKVRSSTLTPKDDNLAVATLI